MTCCHCAGHQHHTQQRKKVDRVWHDKLEVHMPSTGEDRTFQTENRLLHCENDNFDITQHDKDDRLDRLKQVDLIMTCES